jgi:hypothetical protein
MEPGYLLLETRPDQPGLVVARVRSEAPQANADGLRFAARFNDIDAALMHLHQRLRRRLRTLEPRTYAVDLVEAVAAADAIELDHRRVYLDPSLSQSDAVDARIEAYHRRYQLKDWLLQAVGILALIFLVAWGFIVPV